MYAAPPSFGSVTIDRPMKICAAEFSSRRMICDSSVQGAAWPWAPKPKTK